MTIGGSVPAMVPERRSMTIKTEPARRDAVGTYSLEGIYAAEIRRLVSFGTVLTGDASAGEDLAHDAFVQLVRRVNRDPGYLHGPAWPLLRKVIVRLALQRRRTYARELLRLARAWQPAPESVWEPDLSLLDWSAALQTLPPRMRATVILFYGEDLSTADVATELKCSPRTVENQLRLARMRLAAALRPSKDDEDE
jgi:RNA polymerase sigma factor (sigma-70 family)